MRIRVHLRAPPPIVIPLNYAHQLASVVYHLLDRSSPAYATFLHGQGYGTGDRRFKLFTFSPIIGHPRQMVAGHLRFGTSAVSWYITSPVEAFIQHVVQGILSLDQLEIVNVTFAIAQVETLPEPSFTDEMRFTCLSPLTMLIDYKGTKIRGYQALLTVTGPPELLRIGYACGFGDRNSQGFGMVEVARWRASQRP